MFLLNPLKKRKRRERGERIEREKGEKSPSVQLLCQTGMPAGQDGLLLLQLLVLVSKYLFVNALLMNMSEITRWWWMMIYVYLPYIASDSRRKTAVDMKDEEQDETTTGETIGKSNYWFPPKDKRNGKEMRDEMRNWGKASSLIITSSWQDKKEFTLASLIMMSTSLAHTLLVLCFLLRRLG